MPSPGAPANTVTFIDRVFGMQTYDLAHSIGDSIIRRSDGLFSYQFVVTVDDLAMGVDSIVRGRDLLRSTALQSWIRTTLLANGFTADGLAAVSAVSVTSATAATAATPTHPEYAHIPLIENAAGRRLAKRERSSTWAPCANVASPPNKSPATAPTCSGSPPPRNPARRPACSTISAGNRSNATTPIAYSTQPRHNAPTGSHTR